MNKIFTLIFFVIYSLSFSQNLTLDELISLRKKDLATVEEKLTLKGWSFIRGKEPQDGNLGKATFAFNKSTYEDKAESFINYIYSNIYLTKRIDIQIVKKEKYNIFLTRIKALGCKLIDSSISDGSIKKVYQGSTLTFVITITTQIDDFSSTSTLYHFFVVENSDYRNNFDENVVDDNYEVAEAAEEVGVTEEAVIAVDSAAVVTYEPEIEEEVENKSKPIINEAFFIGRWSNENSVITFSNLGEFVQKFDDGNIIVTKWYFIDNKLIVGDYTNLTKYNIIDNDSNYLKYNTDKNQKIFYAYRIGN